MRYGFTKKFAVVAVACLAFPALAYAEVIAENNNGKLYLPVAGS